MTCVWPISSLSLIKHCQFQTFTYKICFHTYELWATGRIAGLARRLPMIWPAPSRGEDVVLTCGCRGTVTWHLPFVFICRMLITARGDGCARPRHVARGRTFVRLETIAARADSQPSA